MIKRGMQFKMNSTKCYPELQDDNVLVLYVGIENEERYPYLDWCSWDCDKNELFVVWEYEKSGNIEFLPLNEFKRLSTNIE